MTTYRPGDVANGYILGSDNLWYPVAPPPPATPPQHAPEAPDYWSRYRSRWPTVGAVFAVLTGLGTYADAHWFESSRTYSLWEFPLAAIVGALVWGSLFNLLFAIPRDD